MTCPKCAHRNDPDANYCLRCGAALEPQRVERPAPASRRIPRSKTLGRLLVATGVALLLITTAALYAAIRSASEIPDPDATHALGVGPSVPPLDASGGTPPPSGVVSATPSSSPLPDETLFVLDGDPLYPENPLDFSLMEASSHDAADEHADMALDGNRDTVWRGTEGTGDWLRFAAERAAEISGVTLIRGAETVKSLRLDFSSGASFVCTFPQEAHEELSDVTLLFGSPVAINAGDSVTITVTQIWEDETQPAFAEIWFLRPEDAP